jgi:predicted CXXCH cytochrome family protein
VLFIVSALKESVPNLLLSTQWGFDQYIDLNVQGAKESFPKTFYKLIPSNATIQKVTFEFRTYYGYLKPDSMTFSYSDTMTIRSFWTLPKFGSIAQSVARNTDITGLILSARGWRDSVYAAVYDDPASEGRALYKLHVKLIPGENRISFSQPGRKDQPVVYRTRYIPGYTAVEDRPDRFHFSALEQNCTTCHEGLPSADSGASMKADCGVCHKAFAAASFVHAPVEMKECGTCHSWSAEKRAPVTEKAVPDGCYGCHPEKQTAVDSSTTPHPVASECTTCHSPHGTDIKHQLKADVYSLCTSCHPAYTINHPIGKHPVRFAKNDLMAEEISCVSCHNPHGTNTPKLLKAEGGSMAICLQCHQK